MRWGGIPGQLGVGEASQLHRGAGSKAEWGGVGRSGAHELSEEDQSGEDENRVFVRGRFAK
jgi:hypothetical protein